jgi:DKNYY family
MAAQYRLENRSVIHQHHYTGETILADADVHSFRVIVDSTIYQSPGVEARFAGKPVDIQNDWFAADSNSVWFMNRRIDGADPASFRGYYGGQCKWGSDRSRVWCFYVDANPKVKPMPKADPSSFDFLFEDFSPYVRQYARDARYVYYYGRRVLGAEPGSFCSYEQDYFLPNDPVRFPFKSRSNYYHCATSNAVWYAGRQLKHADAATFRAIEGGFGVDVNGFWKEIYKLPLVDVLRSEHLNAYVSARPELTQDYWSKIFTNDYFELQRLELQRADTESKVAALRNLPPEAINNGGKMALVLDALGGKEPDIRYAAIQALKNAARNGGDVGAAIPLLATVFEDFRFPSHLLKINVKIRALSIGCEAARAVAYYHLRQGDVPALRALVGRRGWPGRTALAALGGAQTADEIKPFLPLLREMLECGDGPLDSAMPWTMKGAAAGAIANAYWLLKDWQELEALIGHEDERIRLAAIRSLDNLAEANKDIQPVLSRLLAVFDQSDAAFEKTRIAVARVLTWFVLGKNKTRLPTVLHIAGVDILKIPEVQKEIEELKVFKETWEKDR